jgi:hypothetical protein
MQGLTWRHARALACQSVTAEFASGEPLALDLSLNTDGRRCRPGRAGQEAERQKRDDDLQLIELGNSGFHGSATPSYYLVE